jgi:hypothetical protein
MLAMKQFCTITLAICWFSAFSQTQFPLDDQKKIAFTEVVKADSLSDKILYTNAKTWLVANGYQITSSPEDSLAGKLTATTELPVYARGYLFKKIHGKIAYTATIEVKENKYRYNFTQFVFKYHKEDRNYKMVPTSKTKPLEEDKASGWQGLWESHLKYTYTAVSNNIATLKTAMLTKPEVKKEPAVTAIKENTEKW